MLTFLRTLSFTALVALFLASSVQAAPHNNDVAGLTNAQRFARGLGPAPPKRRFNPSRVGVPRSAPSNIPNPEGVIEIHTGSINGPLVGWVGDSDNIVGTHSNAPRFRYTQPGVAGSLVEIIRTSNNRRLCATADTSADRVIGPGSFRHLESDVCNNGFTTAANSQPVATGSDFGETTIFSIDSSTGAITVQWVNQGSTKPNTIPVRINGRLHYTGDPTAYQNDEQETVTVVYLKFNVE
ncbi:hypothetical protein FRC02_002786 [Tulasnella sp. 418]|nr:hypothetical protein FRC02_002786 [Tulasnella sp. 418]